MGNKNIVNVDKGIRLARVSYKQTVQKSFGDFSVNGLAYIPEEVYLENKEEIDRLVVREYYDYSTDKYVDMDVEVEVMTLEEAILGRYGMYANDEDAQGWYIVTNKILETTGVGVRAISLIVDKIYRTEQDRLVKSGKFGQHDKIYNKIREEDGSLKVGVFLNHVLGNELANKAEDYVLDTYKYEIEEGLVVPNEHYLRV